jgi:hypothetical protein
VADYLFEHFQWSSTVNLKRAAWKDANCGLGKKGRSLLFKLSLEVEIWFWKFFRGAQNNFGRFCFGKTLELGRTKFP